MAVTRSLCAWSQIKSCKRSSDMVVRIAVRVRSTLENTRSRVAVEPGNVANTLSSVWILGKVKVGHWLSASSALAGWWIDPNLLIHRCCHNNYSTHSLIWLCCQVARRPAYFTTTGLTTSQLLSTTFSGRSFISTAADLEGHQIWQWNIFNMNLF